jgi:5-methylcytosine-specific restriction endonuclease McrA
MSAQTREIATTVRGATLEWRTLWAESERLRKEARKTKMCAFCGKPVVWPQRTYCSYKCSYDFSMKYYGHRWEFYRRETIKRDAHKCAKCGRVDQPDRCSCEVDHILEVEEGGTDDPANLQTLCHTCHRAKTDAYVRSLRPKQKMELVTSQGRENLTSPIPRQLPRSPKGERVG